MRMFVHFYFYLLFIKVLWYSKLITRKKANGKCISGSLGIIFIGEKLFLDMPPQTLPRILFLCCFCCVKSHYLFVLFFSSLKKNVYCSSVKELPTNMSSRKLHGQGEIQRGRQPIYAKCREGQLDAGVLLSVCSLRHLETNSDIQETVQHRMFEVCNRDLPVLNQAP